MVQTPSKPEKEQHHGYQKQMVKAPSGIADYERRLAKLQQKVDQMNQTGFDDMPQIREEEQRANYLTEAADDLTERHIQ